LDIGGKDFTISVTEKAKLILFETDEKFIRVGANPGGCSGWRWTLESTNDLKLSDITFENGKIIVDKDLLTNVIGSIIIDYIDENLIEQGFVFLTKSGQCGCGESFQPLNSNYKNITY
jgi:iron-sulfur cluster assembly protein